MAARTMIRHYGQRAGQEVDQRIRELHEYGNPEEVLLWLEVHARVAELLGSHEDGSSQ
jgi:hypothetical protein